MLICLRVCACLCVCVCVSVTLLPAGGKWKRERGEASKMAAGHECVWLIQRQAISPRWHNWKLEMKKEERGREKRFNQEFKVQRQPYWVKSISKSLGNAISPAMLMGWKPEKAHFSRVARRGFFYSFFYTWLILSRHFEIPCRIDRKWKSKNERQRQKEPRFSRVNWHIWWMTSASGVGVAY